MNYFKMIKNDMIIGAITSNDFMRYMPITDCFVRANEQNGEYVTYKGNFYRATWMCPIRKEVNYIDAQIIAIEKEEFEIYLDALESDEQVEESIPYVDPIDRISLEYIRASKIREMRTACHSTIEAGFDLELRGEVKHFSLDTQDQLNLISLSTMAQTQSLIPYHADGEACIFYTSEEIGEIVETATAFKIYHTTYYNALKSYINALETISEIGAITYGTEIPEEYKSDVLRALEQ